MPHDPAPAMRDVLAAQRAAFTAALPEPLSVRRDRIDRAIALLLDNRDAITAALSADFGNRSAVQTLMTDIMPAVSALKHARRHLVRWSRPERRRPNFPLGLLGARAEVRYQPKGVVGIVAPWNFPVGLVMTPLAQVFAAGNRAMVKPSEYTERTSALLADLVDRAFAVEELAVVLGGADAGAAFCALPFDHLLFTGATGVGRHVMRAAADNLVPVTLELGGKSPVIVGRSADIARTGERIALGKMLNAGQICLAPDYLLVPREREREVVDAVVAGATAQYPTVAGNDDYAAIINDRHYARLTSYVDEARAAGAEVIEVNPAREDFAASNGRKLPLTILRGVDRSMKVMQEEIFGPILPVLTYDQIDGAIDEVNAHDRPLGLYWFGSDTAERERVVERTISGGVSVNDVIFHNAIEDLPFGGIGPSGMGAYHGRDGFLTFSHAKAVYRQSRLDVAGLAGLKPPYGKAAARTLARELKP